MSVNKTAVGLYIYIVMIYIFHVTTLYTAMKGTDVYAGTMYKKTVAINISLRDRCTCR